MEQEANVSTITARQRYSGREIQVRNVVGVELDTHHVRLLHPHGNVTFLSLDAYEVQIPPELLVQKAI